MSVRNSYAIIDIKNEMVMVDQRSMRELDSPEILLDLQDVK